ncbi:hypothetical protein [Myroides odoratus]|uniref:SMI1 / KNR4 family n=1 Tax=Myroides odoratus TaxID=256 RepID=A0A9Q6Z7B9_MYROD|nr:hypothetical protein [Myroides odoratus]EHQ43026.1 hypothetical protein Myrod_2200 [Myroides odoratus DSM 2801]EKB06794.1 hypothetical protein HMPREF9716_02061 [Myroides odoratus CIP 103059]QQU00372.1 hypothetical protein I6I88_00955 [Myroides odoratus]WQD57395.1 hypothetical protein U0010_18075 [Myroides odoratus]STZ30295.1 Uncharacterised protein [Myroides odoratus]
MEYKFTTNPYGQINMSGKMFGIDVATLSQEDWALEGIGWDEWTVEEIQMIIDKSKALQGDQMYGYQVAGSDLMIYIYTDEAQFFSTRSEKEEADISWIFDKFIDFMEQFKAFVRENS